MISSAVPWHHQAMEHVAPQLSEQYLPVPSYEVMKISISKEKDK